MSLQYILSLNDTQAVLETVGGKGASLARLANAGLPVPDGFHITTTAYKQFVALNHLQPAILELLKKARPEQPSTLEAASDAIRELFRRADMPREIAEAIAQAYRTLRAGEAVVAVRSSATAEDLPDLSFAGQQDTFLNISGQPAVLEAAQKCWASLWTARAIGYRLQHHIDQEAVSLAVVVQLLVPAEAAGILFTVNPINGLREQAMITATWGLGEAIVGGLVTPDTLIVEKAKGDVLNRDTADKQVMTVRVKGGTQEQPVPDARRRAPVLSDGEAGELTKLGRQIEKLYGVPMDIEWTLTEGKFAIVQARPITALPEPELPPPTEWKLPNPKGQYMRGSIVDMMPDPLSPLFATLGLPTITGAGMNQVLGVLTDSKPELPVDYMLTINEYAYMGMAFTARQWWWVITKMLFGFPRLVREGLPLWRDQIRPRYVAVVARGQARQVEKLTDAELWAGIQEVNEAAMVHLASLMVATTGSSAGSEMLFTGVYEKLIQRRGDPTAVTFLMGYDSLPIQAEKSLYDLAVWCREQENLASYVLNTPAHQLAAQVTESTARAEAETELDGWPEFQARFQAHLQTYGHIVYDLDFAKLLPLDDPTPMLEVIKMYLRGEGANPHERQQAAEQRRKQAVEAAFNRLGGLRRWAFRKALGMAQTMAQVRENALADIGLGYPLLRRMLRELGRRLGQIEIIAQGDDIFWLKADELRGAVTVLEQGGSPVSLAERVEQRKRTHAALKRITPPPMLPPRKKYLGINVEIFAPVAAESQTGSALKGVAASAGKVTAPACVLHGPEDFDQMKPGGVLVAGTTTPAWTPLFAMASAVVTDIGGPLSHGSIVAREYGIPAVMGTGVATKRIRNGQMITVDGSAGLVTISENGTSGQRL